MKAETTTFYVRKKPPKPSKDFQSLPKPPDPKHHLDVQHVHVQSNAFMRRPCRLWTESLPSGRAVAALPGAGWPIIQETNLRDLRGNGVFRTEATKSHAECRVEWVLGDLQKTPCKFCIIMYTYIDTYRAQYMTFVFGEEKTAYLGWLVVQLEVTQAQQVWHEIPLFNHQHNAPGRPIRWSPRPGRPGRPGRVRSTMKQAQWI